ncbi:MAG: DEAD/DEAH box helicase [Candidatus Anstonellaceae archaeon]
MEFSKMGLDGAILKALDELGFVRPTPIQQQALPLLIQGEDLIGQAKTGTGKTAAFGICILERLLGGKASTYAKPNRPSALVLCPTRELAVQVAEEIKKLGKYLDVRVATVYGGQEIEKQFKALSEGADVVVGTPGRILDHMERKTLLLDEVKIVVLDEADRMLDMGFREDIEKILQATPTNRQTLLFSATMPKEILELGRKYMKFPQEILVSEDSLSVKSIKQYYVEVSKFDKLNAFLTLLSQKKPPLALVFVRTKKGADKLNQILQERGFRSMALHGDMSQSKRNRSMDAFRKSQVNILVATDLASRGLDISGVTHVFNYDLTDDPYTYLHRIGRTGRMGKDGEAISLVFPDQAGIISTIEKIINSKIEKINVEIKPELLPRRQYARKPKQSFGSSKTAGKMKHSHLGSAGSSKRGVFSRGHKYFSRKG